MKYVFSNETIKIGRHILHRIIAVRNFGDVRAGERGGFIESEHNLSHSGNCWVANNAMVYGGARVSGKAKVYGNAQVSGFAKIYGNAHIHGSAHVYGNAQICDNVRVAGSCYIYEGYYFGNVGYKS